MRACACNVVDDGTPHISHDVVPCLPVCWLFDFGCLLRLGSVKKQFTRRFLATPVHAPLE